MRSLMLAAILLASYFATATAEERKFPYQAIVEVEGEYVRSGPGTSFYPTDKLRKGDKVTVHRHDPGGWCMISPPPGSFSWIKAENVQKSGESGGVLKSNGVVIHVGSSLSADEFTTIQGNLSRGEAVQILGERTFQFEDGPRQMYKISPIRREWRWVQRKSIVAADAIQQDPFPGETPSRKRTGPIAEQLEPDTNAFAQPISTSETVTGPDLNVPRNDRPRNTTGQVAGSAEESPFQDRLDSIDNEFREMIKQEPTSWNLAEIEKQYLQLDNEASLPTQSKAIAMRLDAVSRYTKTQRDYQSFLKISEQTRQRDAELAAVQQQRQSDLLGLSGSTPGGSAVPATQALVPPPQPQSNVQALASTATPPGGGDNSPSAPGTANGQGFAGAGMVVSMAKTFAGGPQYALVAPGGKLLAYLIPASGIDMKRSLNQSMGIIGDRVHKQEWGADVITVRGMQPVQLRTSR